MTFRCGHPKVPENTKWGDRCALCYRARLICEKAERDQKKLNRGELLGTVGQRIARSA